MFGKLTELRLKKLYNSIYHYKNNPRAGLKSSARGYFKKTIHLIHTFPHKVDRRVTVQIHSDLNCRMS